MLRPVGSHMRLMRMVRHAEDCGTLYGNLDGTKISSGTTTTTSAGDCCSACKSTPGCSAWNYCYCDLGCAGNPKGTCVLKSMNNPFYPRHCSCTQL
jgi:hypothetical protein